MSDDTPRTNDLNSTETAHEPTPSPQRIGNYRLLQKLGEGGMGEVWEAEQVRPIRRRVALKLIKWGMDTKAVIARFEAERQALALMNHPNVAKVFDAGATDRGRPYFVMELVKGLPFTEYCDAQRLVVKERLELFMQVCEGIQHAHHKGVIHRDIKPSNVLVAREGAKSVPKIIDFGVAKATSQRLTEKTVFTELGQIPSSVLRDVSSIGTCWLSVFRPKYGGVEYPDSFVCLSKTINLPVPNVEVTVVEAYPTGYPLEIVDPTMATTLESDITVDFVTIQGAAESQLAKLILTVPSAAPLHAILLTSLSAPEVDPSWRATFGLLGIGPSGISIASVEGVGRNAQPNPLGECELGVEKTQCVVTVELPDRIGTRLRNLSSPTVQLEVQSLHDLVLERTNLSQYLSLDFQREIAVEIEPTPPSYPDG